MSGFFGIFRPQGGPVDLEAFEQMKTAMQREGFDGMETHVEDKIAMGHLMLKVSPESKYDKTTTEKLLWELYFGRAFSLGITAMNLVTSWG